MAALLVPLLGSVGLVAVAGPAGAAPANDLPSGAVALTGTAATNTLDFGSTAGATYDGASESFSRGETDNGFALGNGGSVWFSWTAATTGTAEISTCGSNIGTNTSTPLAVYNNAPDPTNGYTTAAVVGDNAWSNSGYTETWSGSTNQTSLQQDSQYSGVAWPSTVCTWSSAAKDSMVRFNATAGHVYYVQVAGYSGSSTGSAITDLRVNYSQAAAATPTPAAVPGYTCQRTIRQDSAGRWVVDLGATGPTMPAGAGAPTSVSETWAVPWLTSGVPKTATVTVPDGPEPLGGYTLTFTGVVNSVSGTTWTDRPAGVKAAVQLLDGTHSFTRSFAQQLTGYWYRDGRITGSGWEFNDGSTTHHLTLTYSAVWGYDAVLDGVEVGSVVVQPVDAGAFDLGSAQWVAHIKVKANDLSFANPYTVGGGDWQQVTMRCAVLVDVQNASVGGGSFVGPTQTPPATAPSGGNGQGCSAGVLGDIPLIGGILDSTASLACTVGDLLGRLLDFLIRLLIPNSFPDLSSLTTILSARFPFSIVTQLVDTTRSLVDGVTDGLGTSNGCGPAINVDSVVHDGVAGTAAATPLSGFHLAPQLPVPAAAGCDAGRPAWEDTLTDLFGFRTAVRGLILVGLYVGLFMRALRAFGWGATDLDPVEG